MSLKDTVIGTVRREQVWHQGKFGASYLQRSYCHEKDRLYEINAIMRKKIDGWEKVHWK